MNRSVVLLFVILVFPSLATAQILTLGDAPLRLGMSKQVVLAALSKTSLVVPAENEKDVFTVCPKPGCLGSGMIQFKNDRLVYAEKSWYRATTAQQAISEVIASMVSGFKLSSDSQVPCSVLYFTEHHPDGLIEGISIDCKDKSVRISTSPLTDNGNTRPVADITEEIGSFRLK